MKWISIVFFVGSVGCGVGYPSETSTPEDAGIDAPIVSEPLDAGVDTGLKPRCDIWCQLGSGGATGHDIGPKSDLQ